MPVYNHYTPCTNISQFMHINTIHLSSEPCHNPQHKITEPCERPQMERPHFTVIMLFDSLAKDATPIDATLADIAPPWHHNILTPKKHCTKLRHWTSNFHHAKHETLPWLRQGTLWT